MMDILISLHKGYGLGDSVQMSSVLRHVKKYRPEWRVDYRNEHNVGRGLVDRVLTYQEPLPDKRYTGEIQICLYDTWANWHDRPNTRVSSALHEFFGMEWDPECGQYQIDVSIESRTRVRSILADRDNVVAVHYQGDSSKAKKDLTDRQAYSIYDCIHKLGCEPLLMGRHNPWGGDAEMNCAIISQCRAFVGIDSGPSKCASATDTPTLVTWTGHHPAPFHDPAPNTTHLVPTGYHGLEPVCNEPNVIKWFEDHHEVWQYENNDPVPEIKRWLTRLLG